MEERLNQSVNEVRQCFSRLSVRKGFILVIFFTIPVSVALLFAIDSAEIEKTWSEIIVSYSLYAVPFLLFIWVLLKKEIPKSAIFQGDSADISRIMIVIPLMALSFGIIWVTILGLNSVSAGLGESYLNWMNSVDMFETDSDTGLMQYVLLFILISFVAPVIEEIIFRGIMIERLGAKYSYGAAVIISSILFGMLHINPVGAFITGLVLSMEYLRSRTLMIPILIHIVNNATATIMLFYADFTGTDTGEAETVSSYLDDAWIGILLFAAGTGWLIWYIYQNWSPFVKEQKPFDLGSDEE